jgi:hypothetical protein
MQLTTHVYEVRPRKDKRGVDLVSNVLPFGRVWYGDANAVADAVGYAQHYSRSLTTEFWGHRGRINQTKRSKRDREPVGITSYNGSIRGLNARLGP